MERHPNDSEPTTPALSLPLEEHAGERRRHPRARLQMLIQLRFNSLEDFLTEYATDISVSGMFIRTEEPREEGTLVYLQFLLRGGQKLIEGLARVVRVNPPGDKERVAGVGVEFVNLDPESVALIEEIVSRRSATK
jgi:uncharacterized protein (TIGR02266 family)